MRVDREAFLVAIAAFGGCEQGAPVEATPAPAPVTVTAASVTPPFKVPAFVPSPTPIPPPRPVRQTPRNWFISLPPKDKRNVRSACSDLLERECLARSGVTYRPDADGPEGVALARAPKLELQAVPGLPKDKVLAYCRADFPPPTCETPLVVAFDGQPIEFVPASPAAQFAFVPGTPASSDWPTATTPWIALDLDGDGAITSGAELFGSSTVLPGDARAANGFEGLAALDANGDGVIDARDPMFGRLVLWADGNGDHRSSPGELRRLASVVTSISLAYTRDARCNDRDDCEGERGTLRWRDASGTEHTGAVVDVYVPTR